MKPTPSGVRYMCVGALLATTFITIGVILSCLYGASASLRLANSPTSPQETLQLSDAPAAPAQPISASTSSADRLPPSEEQRLYQRKALVNYGDIWMSPLEVNLILRNLDGKNVYIEYGSGGSTFNFPQFVKHAVSVEHDREWCKKVKEKLSTKPNLSHIDYRCFYVDKGFRGFNTGGRTEGTYPMFKEYVDQIDSAGHDLYDFVLIDGRARVDCSIKILSYISQKTPVFIHDSVRFFKTGEYSPALKYYDMIDSIGGDSRQGIVLLRRKKEYQHLQGDHAAIQQILHEKYNISI
ncbi:unnamed protein product [Agarophyton chilense]|eukprot:gb/GEZJ01004755.1/.p1 GENE.gb/GEZJ01004755.1/~~gb/GEZJ01004755.1/.p1  ORF type:complete len:295 (-),score=41.18 gb/GEZJ01004755.1/:44-928(-)